MFESKHSFNTHSLSPRSVSDKQKLDMASSSKPVGLSAAAATDSDANSSGVAAIANRFNTGAMASDVDGGGEHKLSDRVSAMANRFGSTVADNPNGPRFRQSIRYTRPLDMSKYKAVTEPPSDSDNRRNSARAASRSTVVQESAKSVGDVAAMFNTSSGFLNDGKDADDNDEDGNDGETSRFANAKNLFLKAETQGEEPQESKVSSFARKIESDASSSREAIEVPEDGKLIDMTSMYEANSKKNGSAGSVKPKSSTATATIQNSTGSDATASRVGERASVLERTGTNDDNESDKSNQVESLGNRFANATKLFESGQANSLNNGDVAQPGAAKLSQLTSLVSTESSTSTTSSSVPDTTAVKASVTTADTEDANNKNEVADTPAVALAEKADAGADAASDAGTDPSTPSSRFANAARMFGGM